MFNDSSPPRGYASLETYGASDGAQAGARLRNAHDLLDWMNSYRAGLREEVLAELSPELRKTLETAPRTAWITIEEDSAFLDGVLAVLGRREAKQMWRAYAARFVETPLVRSLFEGTRRLLGLDVGGMARQVPRIWGQSFRGVGDMEAIPQDDASLVIMLTELHPLMLRNPAYLILFEGMFAGLFDLMKSSPNIEVTRAPETGSATFVLCW